MSVSTSVVLEKQKDSQSLVSKESKPEQSDTLKETPKELPKDSVYKSGKEQDESPQTMGTTFKYANDPMANPKAVIDILVNPKAVYGFSPDPKSKRIGQFATYDWTDPKVVSKAKSARSEYHKDNEVMYTLFEKMKKEGKSLEEIARAANEARNKNRLQSYLDRDNKEGYDKVVESNKANYGNELGITAEQALKKYGSWEVVLEKTMSTNPGMDACCGLYDTYYHLYPVAEQVIKSKL